MKGKNAAISATMLSRRGNCGGRGRGRVRGRNNTKDKPSKKNKIECYDCMTAEERA
ncbi:hypothetical protein SERLA73DRAFT_130899, partial [Serpula lacrymans var. lacrymans S7.3]